MDSSGATIIPSEIRSKVEEAYGDLATQNGLDEGENPIRRAELCCDGIDANLMIEEVFEDGDGGADSKDPRVRRSVDKQEMRLLSSQVLHMRREQSEMRAEFSRREDASLVLFKRVNMNIIQLSNTPGRRSAAPAPAEEPEEVIARLVPKLM